MKMIVLMAESRYDLQHTRDQEGSESKYKEGEGERIGCGGMT